MRLIRRLLYLPLITILTIALLLILGIISINTSLPLSDMAPIVAIISGLILLLFFAMDMREATRNWQLPEPEDPPKSEMVVYPKPLKDAVEAIEVAEEYLEKSNGRVHIEIDIEDPEDED